MDQEKVATELGVTAEVKLTDGRPPWDTEGRDDGNAWDVKLSYRGRELVTPFYTGSALGEPDADTVLECLLLDASGIENAAGSFEEWAREYGLDTDSRKAYASWEQAADLTRRLIDLLGDDYDRALRGES